jgi:DNA polymerase I
MSAAGFDLETAGKDVFLADSGFLRLWGVIQDDHTILGTEPEKLIEILSDAPWIYGHNVTGFDLLVLAHLYGADWEALSAKAIDTEILARLDYPPQARDTGGSEDKYGLDAVAARLKLPGKTDDIKALARKHGGYGNIPQDDPEYRAYLEGDLRASAAVFGKLPKTGYGKREHQLASLTGRMTLNGFRVDTELLAERISEGEARKSEALRILRDDYDLPLGRFSWKGRGKDKEEFWEDFGSPLATLEGREWLIEVWDAYGVRNPPLTDKGQLSTSADALAPLAESGLSHPDLRRILRLMQVVTQTRTVYQTVQDHLTADGRVHALISTRQASGRSSVTSPGLTVFGKRGGRHRERDVFIPEDNYSVLSCDLSQVDMRAVAGLCQDPAYMRMFEPGKDAHAEMAIVLFGDPSRRQEVKPVNHGSNYGLGMKKMIASGHDPDLVRKFFEERKRQFPRLVEWQDEIRAEGEAGHLLDNGWGRMMRCDPQRAYTQAPALMGQGAAADILKESLLRLPAHFRPWLRVPVHDEIVACVPDEYTTEATRELREAFTFEWRGVPIFCDISKPGKSWGKVSEK